MKINGQFVVAPTLSELLQQVADDVNAKLRVEMTGTIVAFDPIKRTASVELGETFVLNDGTLLPVPAPLPDVPVFTLQGGTGGVNGGVHVGLPVDVGDECLLVFCDFNIGNWFTSGGQQVPPDQRQHDISDAFAFVGVNSLANPLVSFLAAGEGGLASTLAKVAINPDTDLITVANASGALGPILAALLTAQQAALAALATDPGLQTATKDAALAAATATTTAIAQLAALLY